MHQQKILLLLFVLLIIPIAHSEPSIVQSNKNGIELQTYTSLFSMPEIVYNINANPFNDSTGRRLENDTTSCKITLSNLTNFILIDSQMDYDPSINMFNFTISQDTMIDTGYYPFTVYCNTSNVGGFRTGNIFITNNGKDQSNAGNSKFIIFIPLIISIFFLIVSWMLDAEKYWALKLGLILFGFVFIFQAWHFSNLVISEFFVSENITNAIGDATWLYGMAFMVVITVIIISFIVDIFRLFVGKKYQTGGYNEQE